MFFDACDVLQFFEHGCLCEVNVLIHRRRICRSEICRRVWAHRVFMYTDFSAIKEKEPVVGLPRWQYPGCRVGSLKSVIWLVWLVLSPQVAAATG